MNGLELIRRERERQIKEKGFDATHDDQHKDGSILAAATEIAIDLAMRHGKFNWRRMCSRSMTTIRLNV